MKISRPRRQIISTAARRLPVRSAARVAASTTARPGQPQEERRRKAAEHSGVAKRDVRRTAGLRRVQASTVWASIISSTAIPRAQST